MTRLDPADIARLRLAADLPEMIGRFTKLRRAGRGFVALCPFHDERSPSFSVYRAADGGWRYRCHSAGCGEAGDAIDWLTGREGLSFRDALGVLAGGVLPDGAVHTPADPAAAEKAAREAWAHEAGERGKAAAIWRATLPAAGSVVETYLREARGLTRLNSIPRVLHVLRCGEVSLWDTSRHRPREAWRGPAMVAKIDAPVSDPGAGPRGFGGIGVHLTFLEPDGSGKLDTAGRGLVDFDGRPLSVKKMRGSHKGGCIRLAPLMAGQVLAVGEGIETSLTITDVTGLPAWAAGSLENMAGAAPPGVEGAPHPERPGRFLPPTVPDLSEPAFPWAAVRAAGITTAILLGDGDTKDLIALEAKLRRGANRAAAVGITTRIAMSREGFDFNDLIKRRGAERPGQETGRPEPATLESEHA